MALSAGPNCTCPTLKYSKRMLQHRAIERKQHRVIDHSFTLHCEFYDEKTQRYFYGIHGMF